MSGIDVPLLGVLHPDFIQVFFHSFFFLVARPLNKLSSQRKETVGRADVLNTSHFGDELDAAWLTEEIFISRAMRVYVNFQCLAATITLLASHLGTRVLWRRVNLTLAGGEVLLITSSRRGAVSTNPTFPTPYPSMNVLVRLQMRVVEERFLTMCAAKSIFHQVFCVVVVLQTQLVYEASSAELTFELRGRCMCDRVADQVADIGEGFPTFCFFTDIFSSCAMIQPRHIYAKSKQIGT
jgi:hypothetical protein